MNATDYRKQLEKRVKQTFGPDRDLVNAVLYLMRRLEAEEDDVRSQIENPKSKGHIEDSGLSGVWEEDNDDWCHDKDMEAR